MKNLSRTLIVLMATIKYSALVSDVRGLVGGNVFSRNKGGGYVRTFKKPTNPQTPKQETVRQNMTVLSSGWRELDEEVRIGWNAAAADFPRQNKMGEQIYLSGQALYLAFNSTLLNAGLAIVTTPPNPVEIPACPFSIDAITAAEVSLNFGSLTLTDDFSVIIMATRPVSAGISNQFRSDFKACQVLAGSAATGVVDIFTSYEANVASLTGQVGKKIFIRAMVVVADTGQSNVPVTSSAVVTTV